MALINCPECSKSVSDQSISCPNCGFPIAKIETIHNSVQPSLPRGNIITNEAQSSQLKKGYKQASFTEVIIVLVGTLIFFYFFISSDQSETLLATADQIEETPAEVVIDIETTAEKMINTYKANEVKGDAIYKNKTIKIVGIVDDITSDFSDEAVVLLSSGKNEYTFNNIHASGDHEFHNQAITLSKGDQVTLICTGNGEAIGSPFLKNCSFY